MDSQARIYLLMGKFASGKTTLIRRILTEQTQHKYAIIQNEFAEGQMGIEQPLIMDQTGTPFSSFLELPNGCICCSAKNDLVAAVEYIVSNTPVRRIVVQTNGLADPAAAIKQFWFDQQMNIEAELHSVITMVSARKWEAYSGEEVFLKQCAFATHILVSFVDVQGEERYGVIREELEGVNCESSIERSDQADLNKLLQGESLFNQDILNHLKEKHNHSHPHHHAIRPLFLKGTTTAKSKGELEQHVGELLWESGLKILRIKGVFCLQDHPFVFELQGVQDLFEIKETKTNPSIYNGESRVLIIGQALPSKEIQGMLQIL